VTPTRCNGAASRCARRLDQVVFPTTHNAMSTRADRFTLPNQERSMSRQLGDGVRGLMIDLHRYQGDAYLCHGPCTIGRRRLAEGLCDIGTFMDEHPEEVVVLILESYIEGPELEGALREAGMLEDLHTQAVGAPWPTLGAMVSSGRRVVILDDNADPTRPWDMAVWDFAQETPFSATTPADLDCRENRGRSGNSLFILNHFLTAPTALPRLAEMVNHDPFLVDRARRCRQSRGSAAQLRDGGLLRDRRPLRGVRGARRRGRRRGDVGVHWKDIDDGAWEGITVTLTADDVPRRPAWNIDVVRPGRVRITAGDGARWWGRVEPGWTGLVLLRGEPMTHDDAVVRPITTDDLQSVSAAPGTVAWWRHWSRWFMEEMAASGRSPLRPGLWWVTPTHARDVASLTVVGERRARDAASSRWDAARPVIARAQSDAWLEDLYDREREAQRGRRGAADAAGVAGGEQSGEDVAQAGARGDAPPGAGHRRRGADHVRAARWARPLRRGARGGGAGAVAARLGAEVLAGEH
jgi:hypothetical protein